MEVPGILSWKCCYFSIIHIRWTVKCIYEKNESSYTNMHTSGVFFSAKAGVISCMWSIRTSCRCSHKIESFSTCTKMCIEHSWVQTRNFQVNFDKQSLCILLLYCTKFQATAHRAPMTRPPRQCTTLFLLLLCFFKAFSIYSHLAFLCSLLEQK